MQKKDEEPTAAYLRFNLMDSNTMIMHAGIYNTVGEVVNLVREAHPDKGVVQYHKLVAKPRDGYPGFFELQPRYHIFWRAGDYTAVKTAESGVIVKKEHVASTLPFMQWQTDWTELVWHCKWGTRGLQPMQPSIVLSKSLQLAPSQTMQLIMQS